ncbi:hypothetical protein OF83DRAFT_1137959, partial [Amylostereum chailletii]
MNAVEALFADLGGAHENRDSHNTEGAVIKRPYNDMDSTHRFPVEIMTSIFHLVSSVLDLISVSHVCQRWRAIAQGTPTLWAPCVFSLPTGHVERLAWAKNVPLDIQLSTASPLSPRTPQLLQAAASCVARARNIALFAILCNDEDPTFHGDVSVWSHWRNALSGQPLPLLQGLYVSNRVFTTWQGALPPWEIQPLVAPNLKTVRFLGTFVPFSSTTLTHLDMSCYPKSPGDFCTPTVLIAILESASNTLQTLILGHRFPNVEGLSHSHGPGFHISLPHLHTLSLTGSVKRCIALKQYLHIPPTVDLRLEFNDAFYDED